MSQFDLFSELGPASAPIAPVELPPLRRYHADWLDVKITDEEFAVECAKNQGMSDDLVMLTMLAARGVRTLPCDDQNIPYLYDYVAAPFVIRKHTMPGFAITCRQAPERSTV